MTAAPDYSGAEVWSGDLVSLPANSKSRRAFAQVWVAALLILVTVIIAGFIVHIEVG